ncbi:c-type cytochrome [Thiohalorhabdus sp.]|uniref:c-type cytochrome n=1 Tax=Thiohalorhabdus sp. TaxID=3094134 RepID=UPI002FC3D44E
MTRIAIALMCMLAGGWAGAAQAEEAHGSADKGSGASAEEIVNQGLPDKGVQPCKTCHGKTGESSSPTFPHLAGQHKDYMVQALKGYRSGDRTNAIMNGQASALTEAQIEGLAAYYADQEASLATLSR